MNEIPDSPGRRKPVILVIGGHDPTGAAGIQADIESIAAGGCHPITLITSLTAQNTTIFTEHYPQALEAFRRQAEILLHDITPAACKIGLIGSAHLVAGIADVLESIAPLPVVLDPVLAAGTGTTVAEPQTVALLSERLLPHTTVLTPNHAELRGLSGMADPERGARVLLDRGCRHVLLTGADEAGPRVTNTLFSAREQPVVTHWERLPGTYHGSGCTLAAALAACIARGLDIPAAVDRAQRYTYDSLRHGTLIGHGQLHPDRFHAVDCP